MTLRSSSVSLPHFSFTLPLTCFQFPETRSQSIVDAPVQFHCRYNRPRARRFRATATRSGMLICNRSRDYFLINDLLKKYCERSGGDITNSSSATYAHADAVQSPELVRAPAQRV